MESGEMMEGLKEREKERKMVLNLMYNPGCLLYSNDLLTIHVG